METPLTLNVNGQPREVAAESGTSLLEVLRNDLGLTGAKYGCGEAQCGACTVLINGVATRSCVTSAGSVGTSRIVTIEGLAKSDNQLHPLQKAFIDEGAMQCGYCVPGMIMSAAGLLAKTPNPTEPEIIEHMNGNLCRCCSYLPIVSAIKSAAKAMRGAK